MEVPKGLFLSSISMVRTKIFCVGGCQKGFSFFLTLSAENNDERSPSTRSFDTKTLPELSDPTVSLVGSFFADLISAITSQLNTLNCRFGRALKPPSSHSLSFTSSGDLFHSLVLSDILVLSLTLSTI